MYFSMINSRAIYLEKEAGDSDDESIESENQNINSIFMKQI